MPYPTTQSHRSGSHGLAALRRRRQFSAWRSTRVLLDLRGWPSLRALGTGRQGRYCLWPGDMGESEFICAASPQHALVGEGCGGLAGWCLLDCHASSVVHRVSPAYSQERSKPVNVRSLRGSRKSSPARAQLPYLSQRAHGVADWSSSSSEAGNSTLGDAESTVSQDQRLYRES